jgi:hypothetical protein
MDFFVDVVEGFIVVFAVIAVLTVVAVTASVLEHKRPKWYVFLSSIKGKDILAIVMFIFFILLFGTGIEIF